MVVNELRIAGHFEIPDARVDDEVEVTLRFRVFAIERDQIDVSGFSSDGETKLVDGGLRVLAVATDGEGGAGVPVSAPPAPESPGDARAIRAVTERREAADDWPEPALPPDYWESAQ